MFCQKHTAIVGMLCALLFGVLCGCGMDHPTDSDGLKREQERKALEEAQKQEEEREQAEIDAVWEELTQRWNTCAKQDPDGPTNGKQLVKDKETGRVDFGSGWMGIGVSDGYISLYYHAEKLISETDLSAIGAIFTSDVETSALIRGLQEYNAGIQKREESPHGADHIDFEVNIETNKISELEFSDPYTRYLSRTPLETYASNMVDDEDYLGMARQIISGVLKSPASAIYSNEVIEETDKYGRRLITMAVDAQNAFGAMVRDHYAVIIQYADTDGHFTWNTDFGAQVYSTTKKDSVIEIMKKLNKWDFPFKPYEYDGPDTAEAPRQTSISPSNSDPLALSYLENWSWEANNGDGTSATLLEILAYYFPDSSYTISESEELGTVTIEVSDPGLAIVFSSDGGAPIIPSYSAVSQEEFSELCEDYMNVLRANHS